MTRSVTPAWGLLEFGPLATIGSNARPSLPFDRM